MKKILVMEDDEILNAGLCYNIQKKEMLPVPVYCIKDAKEKLKEKKRDIKKALKAGAKAGGVSLADVRAKILKRRLMKLRTVPTLMFGRILKFWE